MTLYTATKPTPDNPRAPGYSLAQLIEPARGFSDKPKIRAERYIRHGTSSPADVALACFERWGLMRRGLTVRCLPVTARDLGMTRIPA